MVSISCPRTGDGRSVAVDKEENRTAVTDVAIVRDGTISGKTDQWEKVWGLKTSLFPLVMGALRALTPKLDE